MKQFVDENFGFDENSRKFSKWVENAVGKGEIACYEQFLLFPQCFQKACFPQASKGVIVWEWVKVAFSPNLLISLTTVTNVTQFYLSQSTHRHLKQRESVQLVLCQSVLATENPSNAGAGRSIDGCAINGSIGSASAND